MARENRIVKFNDAWIAGLKAEAKTVDYTDQSCPGLSLRITPAGTKTFAFTYWSRNLKKTRRVTIGHYPAVTLAKARDKARGYQADIAAGREPAQAKAAERAEQSTEAHRSARLFE